MPPQAGPTSRSRIQRWLSLPVGIALVVGALLALIILPLSFHPSAIEWRIPELIGLLIAFIALIYAYIHDRQQKASHEQQRATLQQIQTLQSKLETTVIKLTAVQESLSTRYLGPFPSYFDAIVDELEKAHTSIEIYCDMPAYGYYSAEEASLRYQHVLQRKGRTVPIELTCLNAETRRRHTYEQFTEAVWSRLLNDKQKREQLIKFLTRRHVANPEDADRHTFVRTMDEADLFFLREVFPKPPNEISTDIPFYLWIVDGTSAIFAIPSPTDKEDWDEPGFITSDQTLIKALQDMSSRYHQKLSAARLPAINRPRPARTDAATRPLFPG